jgi:hypothetical protein
MSKMGWATYLTSKEEETYAMRGALELENGQQMSRMG